MDSSDKLIPRLVDEAKLTAAWVAEILERLELLQFDLDLPHERGGGSTGLLETANAIVESLDLRPRPLRTDAFRRRLARVSAMSWLRHVRRKAGSRPDILGLTCRILANPAEPESYSLIRFAVVLALRSLYDLPYTNLVLDELRQRYDELRERFYGQQARRQKTNPPRAESFLLDLLFLERWVRRTLKGGNLRAYYRSFIEYPFGIDEGGRRVFTSSEKKLPQLYGDLPDFPSLVNLSFSQPFALPGLDEVTGGLIPSITESTDNADSGEKKANDRDAIGGLVSLVVGEAGSGKTSFCLTLATRMASVGSTVVYLSTEEGRDSLRAKQTSMIGPGVTSWWPGVAGQQRSTIEIENISRDVSLQDVSRSLHKQFQGAITRSSRRGEAELYLAFPAVLVIDSLTALLQATEQASDDAAALVGQGPYIYQRRELGNILQELRNLGVCLFLVGSPDDAKDSGLEYLVDNVIALSTEEVEGAKRHPLRTFDLKKTRLQTSFRGRHILHLSRDKGLQVSPSLEAVLATVNSRAEQPSDSKSRAVIWAPPAGSKRHKAVGATGAVTIRRSAHTLIYGHGSTRKARLGMLVALEPRFPTRPEASWASYLAQHPSRSESVMEFARRALPNTRILVVSFLFGRDYYLDIASRIFRKRFDWSPATFEFGAAALCETLDLYPGLIDAETLIAKVRRAFETAWLEGRPYTAVLIDGVHNLVLQFPLLERESLLWPCLYRFFRSEGVDVVSTFTFFRVARFGAEYSADDLLGEEDRPSIAGSEKLFFHLLVSSSDHSFVVEAPREGEKAPARNWVRVRLAATIDGFSDEPFAFWWDPEDFQYRGEITLSATRSPIIT
jgi:KaiC/GvpD/RAD55 family RecA-like ATPase